MAQFYEIEWVSPPSDSPDKYGNHWYTVKIADKNIRTLAQNPPQEGQVYGEITKETSKAGKEYYRLRRKQVPDGVTPPPPSQPGQIAHMAGQANETLTLLRDNNRMLKFLVGEEEVEDRGDDSGRFEGEQDEPPADAHSEPTPDELGEPVDLSDIPF